MACTPSRSNAGPDAALLSKVKSGLVERDRKLAAYHLEGRVLEAGTEARFIFDYRAPDRMRGSLLSEGHRTLSFDGSQLFELDPPNRRLVRVPMALSPAALSLALAEVFGPFTPEGYRAPLLGSNAEARRISDPRAKEAVELLVRTRDATQGEVQVRYLLRWPELDLLEKSSWIGDARAAVRVLEEHCVPELKLCLPRVLQQISGARDGARTVLEKIELNSPLPVDAFTLTAPPGFETRDRRVK